MGLLLWQPEEDHKCQFVHNHFVITLCPVLSEGTVVAVAMSNTELDSPLLTCAGAASIVLDSSPYPYDCRIDLLRVEVRFGWGAAFGMRLSRAVSSLGAEPPMLGMAVDRESRASTLRDRHTHTMTS